MEILKIYERANKIVNSNLEWEDKYNFIFSDEISKKVKFDWNDPDTSYEEDVLAFMDGFKNYISKCQLN